MGKRTIEVSTELWRKICTVGWRVGDRSIVECTEGLPPGATFCDADYKEDQDTLVLVFEHPDWFEVESEADIPVIDVVYHSYYDGAKKAAEAILAQYIVQDEFEFETVPVDELADVIQGALSDYRETNE